MFGVFVGLFFYYTVWMEERTMKAKKMVAAFLAMAAATALIAGCGGGDKK